MEHLNESPRMDLVSRPFALGLAVLATSLLFTGTTVLLTSGAQAYQTAAVQVAKAPAPSFHKA